ncbi:MAG: hypothetical protein R2746_07795 [Acidimicrobiales bacterium]|nr:hypothetical protein [Actinomycetota bacterium]
MTARTAAAVVLAAALSLGAVACGGSDGDSKATTDLIAELRANGMKKTQAECIARAFADADLTPEEVEAVGKGKVDDLDADALKLYARSASACLGVTVEVPGG